MGKANKYSPENAFRDKNQEEQLKKKQVEELILIKNIALQSLGCPVGISDMEGKIIFVNDACIKFWGLTETKEILGKHVSVFSMDKEVVNKAILIVQQGNVYIGEDTMVKINGTQIDYQVTAEILKSPYGKPIGIMSCFIDITEKKRIEQQLNENQYKFKRLINQSNDIIWRSNLEGTQLLDLSDSFEIIYGASGQEVITNPQRSWMEMVHPDDRSIAEESGNELLRSGRAITEYRIVRPDGEIRWLLDRKSLTYDREGKPIEIVGFATDITNRKQLEEAILLANKNLEQKVSEQIVELKNSQERFRALALHLQNVREEERINISRDIHDDLGSNLTLIKINMEELTENDKNLKKSIKDKLISLINQMDTVIDTLKIIVTKLRPPVLDHFGLIPAMEWQIQQFRMQNKIDVIHDFRLENFRFSSNASTNIFRIFQEILTNILRHSNATKVDISFKVENEKLILKVIDNGVGFDPITTTEANSFGLFNMQERAKSIGGELMIDSIHGIGTTITLLLIKP